MPLLSHKAKQFLWWSVKITIVILAAFFIYNRIHRQSFLLIRDKISNINISSLYLYITIILVLTTINWILECKKWHLLGSLISKISLKQSISQTLIAHLSGFVTPAKAGDYGAKALFFSIEHRKKILFLNFIGNMYQMIATLFFGFLGLGIIAFFTNGTAIFFWGLALFMTFICYQILPKLLRQCNWTLKGNAWHKVKKYWKTISLAIKKKVRFLSFMRYLVFAHQFYFILYILNADITYGFAIACIGAMYLLSSIIPVMQLLDVVVRGGVAVWVFSWFYVSEEIIVTTVLIMWLSNVVLPLLPGAYFLFTSDRPTFTKSSQ